MPGTEGTYAGPMEVDGAVTITHVNLHRRDSRGQQVPLHEVHRMVDWGSNLRDKTAATVRADPRSKTLFSNLGGDVLRESFIREMAQ